MKKYCPALSINITGYESIQEVGLEKKHRNIYVITYQLESENNAEKYFLKIDTNFEKRYDNNYYIKDLLDRGESFLQAKDNAVGRIFKMKNDSAAIIFNETKHNIILIEYFDK
ncbi:MAG TPA: hypothetical protein VFE54_06150 [Mucilaginibacter sp.]|nr:hypothetical protein [Mucilaginibacter sp.]